MGEQRCSVSATGEGKVVLTVAPEAVLTFLLVPSRLWCAVARFRGSAPRGEGAERGRRGLKVERALSRSCLRTLVQAGRAPRPHGPLIRKS